MNVSAWQVAESVWRWRRGHREVPVKPLGQRTVEELQTRKSLRLCLAGLRIWWFDPIAEAMEVADHLPSAKLLRAFGNRWAPFLVTDSLMQDQPDQPTLSMGDRPDGLVVS
jgi:hypothetical protein